MKRNISLSNVGINKLQLSNNNITLNKYLVLTTTQTNKRQKLYFVNVLIT